MKFPARAHTQKRLLHEGPLPPFQNKYGCIQEEIYYSANLSMLSNHDEVITGDLSESPCSRGHYFITAVAHTNLFLLVVENYQNLNSPFNFNCHIKNR